MSLSTASDVSCCRATAAVRAGIDRDTAFGAVTPPIVLSSNFSFDGFGNKRQYDYTRSGNPTRDLLGEALAELEGGAGGVITSTGMGAINLVLNALSFVSDGGRVVVSTARDAGELRVVVADSGPGVPEALRQRIFDPFFSRREGGIGLGLTIVQQIVHVHGGEIEVGESEWGGAAFVLRFGM